MVNLATIKQNNDRFARQGHRGLVCVFAGATSGIGAKTLKRLVLGLQDSTFYVLGRSESRFSAAKAELEKSSPSNRIIFVRAEVTLLKEVDVACEQIIASELKVDYLCMSAGLIPLNGPEYTKEGLEACFACSYYTRIRMLYNLLPLLRQSSRPRILSILNGGKEKALAEDDIGLDHGWGPIAVVNHTTTMTSLIFERMANNEPEMAFVHSFPGLVRTDIFARLDAPRSSGILWAMTLALIRGIVGLAMLCFGMTPEDCGDRQAYLLTSERYGNGAWRINDKCEEVSDPGVMSRYREGSWKERVWDHTVQTFDKVS